MTLFRSTTEEAEASPAKFRSFSAKLVVDYRIRLGSLRIILALSAVFISLGKEFAMRLLFSALFLFVLVGHQAVAGQQLVAMTINPKTRFAPQSMSAFRAHYLRSTWLLLLHFAPSHPQTWMIAVAAQSANIIHIIYIYIYLYKDAPSY